MAKIRYMLPCFLAVLGAAFLSALPGAAGEPSPEIEAGKDQLRLVCFLSDSSGMNQINAAITQGLLAGARESEKVSLSVYGYGDFGDRDFRGRVETFLDMQGDMLISFGTNDVPEAADLVEENRVKLILLDTDVTENPGERIAFIGTDNQGAIREMFQTVKDQVSQANAAVFITHQHSTTFLRRDVLQELAKEDPQIQIQDIYYLSSDSIESFTQMKKILSENSKINTVLCLDGFSSRTAASVIPELEEKDYYTVGFDVSDYTVKALRQGDFDLLVTQDYYDMGKLAVETALDYREGDEPVEIYRPCVLCTKEKAGELEEVYLNGEG